MRFAGARMDAARRGNAIDKHIYLTEVLADAADCLALHRIRKGIAVETFGEKPILVRLPMESDGVIVAGSRRATAIRGPLVKQP